MLRSAPLYYGICTTKAHFHGFLFSNPLIIRFLDTFNLLDIATNSCFLQPPYGLLLVSLSYMLKDVTQVQFPARCNTNAVSCMMYDKLLKAANMHTPRIINENDILPVFE